MPHHAATLFDAASPDGDESPLLGELDALVSLGLLEERRTPDGPAYALTAAGEALGTFRRAD